MTDERVKALWDAALAATPLEEADELMAVKRFASLVLEDAAQLCEEIGRQLQGRATPTENELAAAIRALKP